MNNLLQWIGFDGDSIPEGAEVSFRFANLPESWGVFVFAAAVALVVWFVLRIYRRENDSCPPAAKHFLAALRLGVCAALLFVFLEPSLRYTKSRLQRPVVAVLRDTSESMNTADRYVDERAAGSAARALGETVEGVRGKRPTRVELANHLFGESGAALVEQLSDKGRLRVLDFADRVVEADSPTGESGEPAPDGAAGDAAEGGDELPPRGLVPLQAGGSGTDIARALREALTEKLTSAIVVLTDGQHNSTADLEAAVEEARARNVPVFFVGFGDPDRPRNLSVSNLYADPQVWNQDPFQIQAVLRAEGVGGGPVKVELVEIKEPEGGEPAEEVLDTKLVPLPEEGGQVRLDFSHTPKVAGAKRYTVRASEIEGEANTDDNQPSAPARVQVLDDNARVLMVSGGPSWEYRALTRLLTREKMINLSCWLQSLDSGRLQQGNTPIDVLPATREDLFQYDVVVLLDPDPLEFDEESIELLKAFVREHSGGLLYMPGPVFSGRFLTSSQTSGIKELLPVQLGDVGSMEVNSLLSTNNREWPLAIVPSNTDQPIMRFFSDAQQTLLQWKKLPGTYWSFPALAPKPAARVLIEHSDPTLRRREVARPLLVTGHFGSGRTTYLGFDGTWRWRTKGLDAEFFKRFWIQTTRYLVEGRSLAGKRRGVIETEQFRYQVGDRVRMTARLKQQNFEPLAAEEVKGALSLPDGGTSDVAFRPVAGQPGVYEAVFATSLQGAHRVAVSLQGEGAEGIEIAADFAVTLPVKEIQQAWLDRDRLSELALVSGGAYFDPDGVDALPDALPDRIRSLTSESPPLPVWDNRLLLWLLAGLLTLEWAFRKKFKLL